MPPGRSTRGASSIVAGASPDGSGSAAIRTDEDPQPANGEDGAADATNSNVDPADDRLQSKEGREHVETDESDSETGPDSPSAAAPTGQLPGQPGASNDSESIALSCVLCL